MSYVTPEKVIAPQKRWHMVDVLLDKGENEPSYAIGLWDQRRVIVFRWNGSQEAPGGNPQSRAHPTWIVLDDALYPAIIDMVPDAKKTVARAFLGI